MWQLWTIFYISLWIAASGWFFGGDIKLSNIVFGLGTAVLSFWVAMKTRKK